MLIRTATRGDLPALRDTYMAAARGLHAAGIDQWDEEYPICALPEDIGRGEMFAVLEKGALVGAVTLNERGDIWHEGLDWTQGRALYVHRLVVAPWEQGKGWARRVMEWAHDYARKRGCPWMRLDANLNNRAAIHLYHSMGYRDVGTLAINDQFMAMEKRLGE